MDEQTRESVIRLLGKDGRPRYQDLLRTCVGQDGWLFAVCCDHEPCFEAAVERICVEHAQMERRNAELERIVYKLGGDPTQEDVEAAKREGE